jgi:hypothetical protein
VNLRELISWCDCLYTHSFLQGGTFGCVSWYCEQVTLLCSSSVSLKGPIKQHGWMYMYWYTYNLKQPSALHFKRQQLDSLCAVVQLNM